MFKPRRSQFILTFLVILTSWRYCSAQTAEIDSLKRCLEYKQSDTSRIKTLQELSRVIKDKTVWPAFNQEMLDLAEKHLKTCKRSSPAYLFYSRFYASAFNNKGFLAFQLGDVPKGLENHFRALGIREEIKDPKGIATSLNNIAGIYNFQGETDKAIDFYNRSLEIRTKLKDHIGIAKCLNNIAIIYINTNNLVKATKFSQEALAIEKENNDQIGMAYSFNNLGLICNASKDSLNALVYYLKALKIEPKNSYTLNFIARIYYEMDSLPKAIDYCLQGLKIGKEAGNPINIRNSANLLKEIYLKQNKPAEALTMYEMFIKMRDSIYNAETRKSSIKTQLQYDFDKKELLLTEAKARQTLIYEETARRNKLQFEFEQAQVKSNSEKEKQQLAFDENLKRLRLNEEFKNQKAASKAEQEKKDISSAAQSRQKSLVIYGIIAGLLIVSIFSFYLFRRFRITERQKKIIELQKELVEEHRKEIIDSITYAKRLQQAILPSLQEIKSYFPESFLLYHPKDIVAGDFYWMEHLGNITYIAAADCTGHGVPGAMVSIVCSNALNRAVKEFGMRDTGAILDKTRDLVLETFAKSNSEVKDGMDISILAVDKGKNEVFWSGANNQLWYIEKEEFKEITANKQPIGKIDNPKPFTTHSIVPSEGTTFYLMTDGFPDQFGGPKGKKFKYKPLQEMLLSNVSKPLEEQRGLLAEAFLSWKGNLEQVDDVTIIGIRI